MCMCIYRVRVKGQPCSSPPKAAASASLSYRIETYRTHPRSASAQDCECSGGGEGSGRNIEKKTKESPRPWPSFTIHRPYIHILFTPHFNLTVHSRVPLQLKAPNGLTRMKRPPLRTSFTI